MISKPIRGFLPVLAALLFALSANAQEQAGQPDAAGDTPQAPAPAAPKMSAAELEAKSRQAYDEGNYLQFYIANLKLHEMFPYVPQYMYNLVRATSLLEKYNTAYHFMLKMQQQGLAYDFSETEDTRNIRGTQAYDYINNMMIEANLPTGDAAVALRVPGDPVDFDAIAWDASRGAFLVGTAGEGRLLAIAEDGKPGELLRAGEENGLWSINGIAVDAASSRLWLSSTATPRFAAFSVIDRDRASLFELDLSTLEIVARYNLPVDGLHHELGSVAVTDDGHVYVIDTAMPVVYRKAAGADRIEPFVVSTDMVVFTDIAVTPDNSRVFVADPIKGIFVIDPVAEQAGLLSGPETLNLAGITGIEYADGKLYVIQSGIQPERIMRLQLDQTGTGVVESAPMAIAIEAFDRPGYSTLRDGGLFYFANQAGNENPDEAIVLRTALDANAGTKVDIETLQKVLQPKQP